MTRQHRADPEEWVNIKRYVANNDEFASCLLDVRCQVQELESGLEELTSSVHFVVKAVTDRIEKLESNAKPTSNFSQIRSSLLSRVATTLSEITGAEEPPEQWYPEARAAIREVAAFLREIGNNGSAVDLERHLK